MSPQHRVDTFLLCQESVSRLLTILYLNESWPFKIAPIPPFLTAAPFAIYCYY